ncbi:serine hydrolase domain-containing protein [Actinoalloteichus hymeniacidonis]|uniref:Penicillin-binding protein, beta-lactamase class C n=1 Tax=Actinoalloteichus hymeniacidonis TaxID=340345 RepID=A0AAC9HRS6_9PSEU|nr:serine hydrolase domain-containing protein [Actinoalloteichus hymeniacidonis]AOS64164.1 penicillin-binding protein, beta-lactamase class C [Actinoalloteichus hymeniacidonis]MBB5907769.1 D-alanyl-D-alanine carboxypeptidase [Actinoalloteichus hymeniacidonis]
MSHSNRSRLGRRCRGLAALTVPLLLMGAVAPVASAETSVSTTAPAALAGARDARADVEAELRRMVDAGAPGVAVTTIEDGSGWQAADGVGNLDDNTPMPEDGAFRAASITKTMVAVAVLQLVDDGSLALTDSLEELVPGLVPDAEQITVEQLLNHTAGLADYTVTLTEQPPSEYGKRTFSPTELVQMGVALGTVGAPGEAFHYSNTGYVLLGMIVETVTGRDLAEVLDTEVWSPSGMTDTTLPITDPRLPAGHPSGYFMQDGQRQDVTEINPSFAWAAYGAVSTAEDLHRFWAGLLSGGLLSPESTEALRETVPTGHEFWPSYGLGIEEMATTCGVELWGHTGSIPGYTTVSFATEDGRHQATVLINQQDTGPESALVTIGSMNIVNLEFCGVPYLDLSARDSGAIDTGSGLRAMLER